MYRRGYNLIRYDVKPYRDNICCSFEHISYMGWKKKQFFNHNERYFLPVSRAVNVFLSEFCNNAINIIKYPSCDMGTRIYQIVYKISPARHLTG